jgi:hypothetical protein
MADNRIDLNELAYRPEHNLSITPREDPEVRDSRLRVEEANAAHQRRKEVILYYNTSVVLALVVIVCSWTILKRGLTTEEGKLALALLTSIVTGLLGYVTGRASK